MKRTLSNLLTLVFLSGSPSYASQINASPAHLAPQEENSIKKPSPTFEPLPAPVPTSSPTPPFSPLLTREEYEKRKTTYISPDIYSWWSGIPEKELDKITEEMTQEGNRQKYIREISAESKKQLEKSEKTSATNQTFQFILGAAILGGIIGFLVNQFRGGSSTKESILTGAGVGAATSLGCLWEVFKLVVGFLIVMWVLSFIFGN